MTNEQKRLSDLRTFHWHLLDELDRAAPFVVRDVLMRDLWNWWYSMAANMQARFGLGDFG